MFQFYHDCNTFPMLCIYGKQKELVKIFHFPDHCKYKYCQTLPFCFGVNCKNVFFRFGRHTSFDVEKNEFLCPLCERLSNTVIPIIPPLSTLIPSSLTIKPAEISIDDWLSSIKKVIEGFQPESIEDLSCGMYLFFC